MSYPITDEVVHALKTVPLPEPISLAREKLVALCEVGCDQADTEGENDRLRAKVRELEAQLADRDSRLEQAATWFTDYAGNHDAKGDAEKANRNRHRALYCRRITA